MTKTDFISAIEKKTAEEFYEEYYISGDVWVFKMKFGGDWFEQYNSFKKFVSRKLV